MTAALAGLLLGAALAAEPGRLALRAPDRTASLEVSLDSAPAAGPATTALRFRPGGTGAVAQARDGLREVEVRLSPAGVGVDLEVRVRYVAELRAEREAIRIRFRGPLRAVTSDLGYRAVAKPVRLERGTPIVVAGRDVAVVGGPGLAAAHLSERAGMAEVELVLDDEGSHPFAVYEHCLAEMPEDDEGQVSFADLERKRPEGRIPRRPGDEIRARATLYVADGGAVLPLVVERWPAGTSAAVVFTDHADRTDPDALRAILYGDSRPFCRPGGPGGFLGRGLRLTKSFFVQAHRGGLEDPETAALAREILLAGSEVASHSPTPAADDREAVRAALPLLGRFGVTTWIDHQPYTNCEAISAEGWRAEGPYGVRDLLAGAGFRWVWEAGDVGGFAREPAVYNLFAPGLPPATYPLPVDGRLWVFGSTMFQGTPEALGRALSDAALDRLEAERGLFVAHTYLAAAPRTTSSAALVSRLVVREVPGGLELHPAFDQALERLERRVKGGTLASLTWEQAGGRLRALGDVEVTYRADGSAEVTNRGAEAVAGLTVSLPAPDLELEVEGVGGLGAESGPTTRAWFDLPPGGTAVVRARRGGEEIHLVAASPAAVEIAGGKP
ncbi:MAG TPA: hypothetical protein VMT17_10450 [Anaeromyxobacteraceae bacterium]|nr:hypothetical protein [Anaeromyxobacteraceae bacterium]